MTRVALYARYSDDKQSPASIEDQLRICREQAEREGWQVVATYKDAAISGASVVLRPGIKALLRDAMAGQFDLVMAEALDRVSRGQADIATLFSHLQFAGVPIFTLAEGAISELHVGLKGTMNALFLKDLAKKTHRGLRGRVEKGKSGGGLCYGYDVVKRLNSEGEPVRGERAVNPVEAAVIRRIFREYARGVSPQVIARRLNAEGVPGPSGRLWTGTTLRGHAKRGTGLINNELYIGQLVWNRQHYVKNPRTGKRVARINPRSEWIVTEVPDLRIVDDVLWQTVKARQAEIQVQYAGTIEATRAATSGLRRTNRPRSLLSGLVICGCCGGPYTLRGQGRFACTNHVDTRTCDNSRTIARDKLEERVLSGLKDRLMAPEMVAEAIRAYVAEVNRLNQEQRASSAADKAKLAKVDKALNEIVTAIEEGRNSPTLMDRLMGLEDEKAAIRARLDAAPDDTPDIHPNIAEIYRRKITRLAEAVNHPDERDEAADAIRGLIEKVTLVPGAKRGEVHATLHGEFGTILDWLEQRQGSPNDTTPGAFASGVSGVSVVVGAGAGFEPATFRL